MKPDVDKAAPELTRGPVAVDPQRVRAGSSLLYGAATLVSGLLLFQVQPIAAKAILPWFGGSAAVWSASLLFFQAALVGGYLYAHWLQKRLSARRQLLVHALAILVSLLWLPITPAAHWKTLTVHPAVTILLLLMATVGGPYLLLSATSPLLQAWYAAAQCGPIPYRLYAISSLGSLAGLLSYPFLVEPHFAVGTQQRVWSAAYVGFGLLCVITGWVFLRSAPEPRSSASVPEALTPPGWRAHLWWATLACCPSILLVALTAYLTRDVAPVPLLWVLPLSAYLLSFILCFEWPSFYRRPVWISLLLVFLAGFTYILWPAPFRRPFPLLLAVALGVVFTAAMVCHGELVRSRPHPRWLTQFYVSLSVGGAAGGLFVGLAAPVIFHAALELPIGIAFCAVLVSIFLWRGARFRWQRAGIAAGACLYVGVLFYCAWSPLRETRMVRRNFYAQLIVRDVDEDDGAGLRRRLTHGTTIHGEQLLEPGKERQPATYYCQGSGIALALALGDKNVPRRVGVAGLGCGALAVYARPRDTFRFYEINPQVVELARSEFSLLRDAPARIQIVLGDARLSLEAEPDQRFDLLVLDAFSGDSVPAHLLTREAMRLYARHLAPGGILAFNVSNRYLNLDPVVAAGAAAIGRTAVRYEFEPSEDQPECFVSWWALVFDDDARQRFPDLVAAGKVLRVPPGFRTWTDDYSNVLSILRGGLMERLLR